MLVWLWKRQWNFSHYYHFCSLQKDPPCQHPAVHGLHDQAQLCHHHTVVWRQQPVPPSACHRNQVWHYASHWCGQTDSTGHGVRLAARFHITIYHNIQCQFNVVFIPVQNFLYFVRMDISLVGINYFMIDITFTFHKLKSFLLGQYLVSAMVWKVTSRI